MPISCTVKRIKGNCNGRFADIGSSVSKYFNYFKSKSSANYDISSWTRRAMGRGGKEGAVAWKEGGTGISFSILSMTNERGGVKFISTSVGSRENGRAEREISIPFPNGRLIARRLNRIGCVRL